ncbi:MAG: PD40 domain-containing protein [Chloroflexota bacterium]|nr:PD40 domain-containing protein [Chloroflexota bacterium]
MRDQRDDADEALVVALLRRSDGDLKVRPFQPQAGRSSLASRAVATALVLILAVIVGTQLAGYRQRTATSSPSPSALASSPASLPSPPASPATPAPSASPNVDIGAFSGLGVLAFDLQNALWILDGGTHILTRVDEAGSELAWSATGDWLAYTKPRAGLVDLWLIRADGSARRRVAGLPDAKYLRFLWSPRNDELAVNVVGPSGDGSVWIASPTGPDRVLLRESAGFIWSADGATLIYGTTLPYTRPEDRSDALWTIPAAGGTPRQWWIAQRAGIELDSPLPSGDGVLLFEDPQHGNSAMADGLRPEILRFGEAAPRPLPVVATGTQRWWLDGRTVVLLAGQGRFIWNNKTVTRCDTVAMTCTPIAGDASTVALEPSVSPDGARIAFVRAPDRGFTGFTDQTAIDGWNATRRLWIGPLASPREVSSLGQGIFAPDWAPDGHHLLFIRDDAIWLTDDSASAPRKLVGDLGLQARPWSLSWPHAWHRTPADRGRPVGFTLPSGCVFVNDGFPSGRRYNWFVDCGQGANAHAADTLGPPFAAQGWVTCGLSGSATWLKGDYALSVTDANATSRGYVVLTQSPREIVSCR